MQRFFCKKYLSMSKYFSMIRQKSSQICSLNVQKSFNGFFAAKYAEYSIVPIILQQPIDAVIWIWIILLIITLHTKPNIKCLQEPTVIFEAEQ